MSKEKSPAKSSRQTKAPSISSDKHPMFQPIRAKGLDLYSKPSTSDGSKPTLTKRK